jgi:thioredoxin-like negative regulator of GroEL
MMDLTRDYEGRVKVCELNAQASPQAAGRLGVRGTPTVLYINKGKVLDRVVGFRSSVYHQQAIEELFGVSDGS